MKAPTPTPTYPLSAIVGQEELRLALLLAAIDPGIGGVLLRGQKGSGKTTAARGLALLLGGAPFVELPLGASEDRVTGSIDLRAALVEGEQRFAPGVLAAAHGGVLYVDEVNLLADHLVDVLLDVAATGVNRVEREGISHVHDSRFVLLGSMNPEEGELRPQLLDRFGLSVDVVAPITAPERAEVVRRRLAYEADAVAFCARFAADEEELSVRLRQAEPAGLEPRLPEAVAELCIAAGAEGLRADIVCCRAAAALAGWRSKSVAGEDEVRAVAALALAHRRRRSPFEEHGIPAPELADALDRAFGPRPAAAPSDSPRLEGRGAMGGPATEGPDIAGGQRVGNSADGQAPRAEPPERRASEPARSGPLAAEPALRRDPLPGAGLAGHGRRHAVEDRTGRLVGDRVPSGPVSSVAVGATLRASAFRRVTGTTAPVDASPGASGGVATIGAATCVTPDDVRQAVRVRKAGALVVLAVDASGSMGADSRMAAAKGAVLSLLSDAYQHRDRVALVTFRDNAATVTLRPTGSVEVARARLLDLPTGGRTPLAAGIDTALEVALSGPDECRPVLVLVSDGRATAAPDDSDPLEAAITAARRVAHRGVSSLVVDAEQGVAQLGLASRLADEMGARYVRADELAGDVLAHAVRGTVDGLNSRGPTPRR